MNVLSRFRRAGRPAHSRLADAVLPAIVALTAGAGAASPPPAPAPVTTGEPPKKKITRAEAFEAAVQLMAKSTGRNVDEVRQHLQALRASPTPPPPPAPVQQNDTPADVIALAKRRKEDLVSLQGIYSLGEDFVMLGLKENWDTETAQQKATEFLTNKARPLNVHVSPDNNLVSLRSSIGDAIRLRAGAKIEKPHERADKLRALSLLDMGRHYLSAIGHPDAWTLGRSTLVGLLVNPRELRAQPGGGQMVMLAESVGDFPGILKDAINKTLIQAYRDASPTWKQWARRATAPDFKTINRVNLSESPNLVARPVGMGITYVQLSDTNETYMLAEYTNGILLTRRAMINDDLDVFNRIPMLQGNAAGRKEEDVAYAQITSNPTMVNDGIALFNAAHNNYVATGSGAAPSVTTLQTAYQKMRTQKGPAGQARLNIEPRFLFVPVALEASAKQLINSEQLLAVVSTTSSAPQVVGNANPYSDRLKIISNPRLDDVSATGWYLAGYYGDGQVDTVEVAFLEDEPEPVLKQETEFDTDSQKFAVRHTVASKVIDFRGLFFNAGV